MKDVTSLMITYNRFTLTVLSVEEPLGWFKGLAGRLLPLVLDLGISEELITLWG